MTFSSSKRSRRHRNKNQNEKKDQPFFSKTTTPDVQTKEEETPFFQTKLTIGEPGDKYEQEADQMADAVVNKTNDTPAVQPKEEGTIQRITLATPEKDEKFSTAEQRMEEDKLIQEKPEAQPMPKEEEQPDMMAMHEEEEQGRLMPEEEESTAPTNVMTKRASGAKPVASEQLSQKVEQSKGKGKPLSPNVQQEMEQSMGADFSGVHIHTNDHAVQMNKELGAQAFTTGKDVYFNSGKYNPETHSGKHLLAHELTHVVQQTPTAKKSTSTANPTKSSSKSPSKTGGSMIQGSFWDVVSGVSNYLYNVGESAASFVWTTVTQIPNRLGRLIYHVLSPLWEIPMWLYEGATKLFAGDWSGLGQWLLDGIIGGAAWVGRLFTKLLDLFGVGELLDLIFQIIKVNTRKLNGVEQAEAQKVFGSSIAYWKVRIDEISLIAKIGAAFQGGNLGVVLFHTVNFSRPISAAPGNGDMAWLIHELVHVAQMEQVGMQYIGEAIYGQITAGYSYGGGAGLLGKNLRDFNREQQGDIIKDYYRFVLYGSSPYAAEYHRMIADLQAGRL